MAFESLSARLQKTMRNLSGQGKLTEKNMDEMLREVRLSLLEADVNYGVVKNFVENVKEKAMGQEVLSSLNPSQMVLKIVRDELQSLMGQEDAKIHYAASGPTSIMMAGLQGTGKTTASSKIAHFSKKRMNQKVLLVACDVIRPAAIEQLQTLGASSGIEVFSLGPEVSSLETARAADAYARKNGFDLVVYDTAGRLHIDEDLMEELSQMKELIQPEEILLTVDAMTGQDLVNVAKEFDDQLDITGLIVTKMDGDARGGGLLSVRSITDVPVLFISSGEKIEDLEEFHPDRMAERILGMGDMLSLIEEAQDKLDEELAAKSMDRMMAGIFTFNDLYDQIEQMNRMGSAKKLLGMVPGMSQFSKAIDDEVASKKIGKQKAIIQSMTPYERENPKSLKASRKRRIANGSGSTIQEVNTLIKSLEQMQALMSMMSSGNMGSLMGMSNPFSRMQRGGGMLGASKHSGSKKQKAPRKKKKKRR